MIKLDWKSLKIPRFRSRREQEAHEFIAVQRECDKFIMTYMEQANYFTVPTKKVGLENK